MRINLGLGIFNLATLAAVLVLIPAAHATPFLYTGGTYTQNFDGLPTNLTNASQTGLPKNAFDLNPNVTGVSDLTGWQGNNNVGGTGGTGTSTEFKSQDGSLSGNAGRGVESFGTNGSTERALGTLATSAQINAFGLVLQNNTGTTLTQFTLSYTGEQWRRGDAGTHDALNFNYDAGGAGTKIDSTLAGTDTALNFTSPNISTTSTNVALNGNDAANEASLSDTITGLSWDDGQLLVLRWSGQDLSGQDDGLGIDNLSFSATAVAAPEPCSLTLAGLALVGMVVARGRRRAVCLNRD